jgi:Leucine-rich repeat (LRR) protein
MKEKGFSVLLFFTLLIFIISNTMFSVVAAFEEETGPSKEKWSNSSYIDVINPYFSIEHSTLDDGTDISAYIINGPPKPPPGYETERSAAMITIETSTTLPNFPSYSWVFGCSAVSGAIIAAYYDHNGYPNMYAGPTNNGLMPLTDTVWSNWIDINGAQYPNNPLVASHNGVDGRTSRGSIDNYWVAYQSTDPDPYIINEWPEHAWSTAIGDFMKTSQSAYSNSDGSTRFYNYSTSNQQLTCADMELNEIAHLDGTFGRKLFYEARGYTVTDCYNQQTDNQINGGFSFIDYQAEINSGHPVLINLSGHSVVGFGYSGDDILIRDTWDSNSNNIYTMPWGGSYHGMELNSVSIVRLQQDNTFNCNNASDVSTEECNALVALYNSTNGAAWNNNDNWLNDNSINNWFGVNIQDGHIDNITLEWNNLIGTIPTELRDLSELRQLSLSGNMLAGAIPNEIGTLANLRWLFLGYNNLSGPVPTTLGQLSSLEALDLGGNQLAGEIPPQLGDLSKLQSLHLWGNQLTGPIPIELGNLSELQELGLGGNQLTGTIPNAIWGLTNLRMLILDNNDLEGTLPATINQLENLEYLHLHNNRFDGEIPPEVGELSQLKELILYLNGFTGTIPDEIFLLSNLENLDLGDNALEGSIPNLFGEVPLLSILSLTENQLSGPIPTSLGVLSELKELNLAGNQLSGSIPNQIGMLNNLKWLFLGWNNLNGSIPASLGGLTNIEAIDFGGNQLSGEIPSQLGDLSKLQSLHLWGNQLTGPIPIELGNLSELQELGLGGNQLTGTIPNAIWGLTNLRMLILDNNDLEGTLPATINQLENLEYLHLHNNRFDGEIPPEVGELSQLKELILYLNGFTGTIPDEIFLLSNLENLDLGDNALEGSIPNLFGEVPLLSILSLTENQLSGPIPTSLGVLSELKELNLAGNQLSGSIPDQIGMLNNLKWLFLGWNNLNGSIPASLGGLTNIEAIDFGGNQLSGEIPSQLGDLSKLQSLHLWGNQLTGPIPIELGNLIEIQELGLGGNQLTGTIPNAIWGLTNLRMLILDNNDFEGTLPATINQLENLEYLHLHNNHFDGKIPPEVGVLIKLYELNLSQNKFYGSIPESMVNLTQLCTPDSGLTDCWVDYGLDLGFNLLTTTGLSLNLLDFLAIKDPDWYLTQAVEQTISGEIGGTIVSNDTNTEISIPPNAVDGDVTFTFAPQPAPAYETGDLYFAGNSFELTAQDSLGDPITTFAQPIIITLHYKEADLGDIPEENLFLYYWDEDSAAWVDVVTTCDTGSYTRNLEENWLSVPICHLSQFALMGTEDVAENAAPVAEDQSVETTQDTPLQITLVASDADGDPLTYEIVAGPNFGTLQYAPAELPVLTYSPNPGYFGPDSFTFKAHDGELDSNIATVTITISEKEDENTAPVAEDQSVKTDQDTPLQITLVASDADGDPLTYFIVDDPEHGSLTYQPDDLPTLTYTPNPGYFGSDSFTFKVYDGELYSNIATVTISVTESGEPSVFWIFLPLITK